MPRSDSSKPKVFVPPKFPLATPIKIKPFVYTSPKTPVAIPPVRTQQPTLGQTVKEGFGFGLGASVARNIVDRMFGLPSVAKVSTKSTEYTQCIQEGGTEEVCKQYE